jgi:hypothetical protein
MVRSFRPKGFGIAMRFFAECFLEPQDVPLRGDARLGLDAVQAPRRFVATQFRVARFGRHMSPYDRQHDHPPQDGDGPRDEDG